MDTNNKPTADVIKDLLEHQGWRYMEQWMNERKEDCKTRLLNASSMEEVIKEQAKYETYQNIASKIKSLSKK